QATTKTTGASCILSLILRIAQHVRHMTNGTRSDRARCDRFFAASYRKCAPSRFHLCFRHAMDRRHTDKLTVDNGNDTDLRIAQFLSWLADSFEHWLDVSRRTRNNAQHVRGCFLLFQRFRQLVRTLLLRLEQPRILDSDHRLIGESLRQLNLLVGERTY